MTGSGLMAVNRLFGAGVDVHQSMNNLECSRGASQCTLVMEGSKGASQCEGDSTVGRGEMSPDKALNHPVGVEVQLGLGEATVDWNPVRGIHLSMGMPYQMALDKLRQPSPKDGKERREFCLGQMRLDTDASAHATAGIFSQNTKQGFVCLRLLMDSAAQSETRRRMKLKQDCVDAWQVVCHERLSSGNPMLEDYECRGIKSYTSMLNTERIDTARGWAITLRAPAGTRVAGGTGINLADPELGGGGVHSQD